MSAESSMLADRRIREWFAQQQVMKTHEHKAEEIRTIPERAVVTISREYGAGGHTIAKHVAEELGADWQIWDRELVDAIAENAHVRKEMVEHLDERTHSLIEQILRYTVDVYPISPDRYHRELVEVLVSLAHQGKKIIIGRGANYVLTPALKVRLIASVDYRVRAIMQREDLNRDDALAKLQQIDKQRAEFVRNIFGRDVDDPAGYDIILRMDHLHVDTAVAAVVAGIRHHMTAVRHHHVHVPVNGG